MFENITFSFRRYQRECLRKFLPYLCPESSPETTRPPSQLTPGRSLTCLGLPGFAFSPSLLFSRLSLFCFSFGNSCPKPAPRKRPWIPLLLRPLGCLTRSVALDPLNELLFIESTSIFPSLRPFLSPFKRDNFLDGIAVVLRLGISVSFSNPLPY